MMLPWTSYGSCKDEMDADDVVYVRTAARVVVALVVSIVMVTYTYALIRV